MAQSRVGRRKQRTKRILHTVMNIGIASFVLFGGAIGYMLMKLSDVSSNTKQELVRGEKSEKREEAVSPNKDNISLLFLGVDDRDGDLQGRTDAMLLATFNKKLGTIQ